MNADERQTDAQWQAWTADWAATSTADELTPLGGLLAAQRRRRWVAVAGEAAMVAALVLLTAVLLPGETPAWQVVWLATLWGFLLLALGFAYWYRRATWHPSGATVRDHLRLSRLRCRRELAAVRFGWLLFAAEAVAVVWQLHWFDRLVPEAVLLLAGAGLAFAAWTVATRRRIRRELASIDRFAGTLGDEGEIGAGGDV